MYIKPGPEVGKIFSEAQHDRYDAKTLQFLKIGTGASLTTLEVLGLTTLGWLKGVYGSTRQRSPIQALTTPGLGASNLTVLVVGLYPLQRLFV